MVIVGVVMRRAIRVHGSLACRLRTSHGRISGLGLLLAARGHVLDARTMADSTTTSERWAWCNLRGQGFDDVYDGPEQQAGQHARPH